MSSAKKSRLFQDRWQEEYGFIQIGEKVACAICGDTIVARTSSVQRHFNTTHLQSLTTMDLVDRKEYLKNKVSAFQKQQTSILTFVKDSNVPAAKASYTMSLCIAKHGKPFTDGEYLKE